MANVDRVAKVTKAKRDELVVRYTPLVKAIARVIWLDLPAIVELDDLVSAGVLGLIDATLKYKSNRGVTFPRYANARIRGAIIDYLRQLDWASRDMRRLFKKTEEARRQIEGTLLRTATESEVAEKMGMGLSEWRRVQPTAGIAMDLRHGQLSACTLPPSFDEDCVPPDVADPPEKWPDQLCEQSEMVKALNAALDELPRRYRRIMVLYYQGEINMREVGVVMGVNESRVSQIHKESLKRMKAHFEQGGIMSAGVFLRAAA